MGMVVIPNKQAEISRRLHYGLFFENIPNIFIF